MNTVIEMAEKALAVDQVAPFNEATLIGLHDGRPARVYQVTEASAAVAFDDAPVELVVVPDERGRGRGRKLLGELLDHGETQFWAHGDLPAARHLATSLGLEPRRTLLVLRLDASMRPPEPSVPSALTIRSFRPEDTDAVIAVNSAAFVNHPEQGSMDREQFERRTREAWFDAQGLLIAEKDSAVVGFHWTKTEHDESGNPIGEVYVVGVDPAAHGHGIGKALTAAGLVHLWDRGARTIDLYVEGDNEPALSIYHGLGFRHHGIDVLYSPARTNYRVGSSRVHQDMAS